MKFLFDLFPVLLFFGAYSITRDIFVATATAIVATVVQLVYSYVRHRKIDTMLWISFALIVVFGGATLLFHNKTFIFWKPTALYWLFSLVLAGSWQFRKINLIEKLMKEQIALPAPVWKRLLHAWTAFFAVMGCLNLVVVYFVTAGMLGEDVWVKFKVFGTLALTLVFVVAQSFYISRFMEQDKTP
ncbi:intracellular septation protein [Formivibrio citricus]|uniref:Inner membrane-spanning protein YciB n=1 Tax=Formivibrio citricus TaxID=83765 RepID=A0A1I4WHP5_9NEIS|nr:septation protein A [Formivibrio citricus]SFN12793.1 intracellular septation protein [Formivibrio citricus]